MRNPVQAILDKIETLPEETREGMLAEMSKALTFGLAVSANAQVLDAQPILLFTRRNYVTGEVECIHPDSPEPIFEPARIVLSRMLDEIPPAKPATLN